MKVLMAYASVHGSTAEVAHFIRDVLESWGYEVDVADVIAISQVSNYDAVILGSAVHNGMALPEMTAFVRRFRDRLVRMPLYLFIMCIRALEVDGLDHVRYHYLPQSGLDDLPVEALGVFAGKLELDNINWNEAWTLAVRYDGTAAPREHDGDYRDWEAIQKWTMQVAESINQLAGEARG
jgi:menaquinone-dependent protoporphyrinogen oxidase